MTFIIFQMMTTNIIHQPRTTQTVNTFLIALMCCDGGKKKRQIISVRVFENKYKTRAPRGPG